tara:strand:+ start:433 stop:657 length:225 start_codon:yes stop_codon:yes gene_type:complete
MKNNPFSIVLAKFDLTQLFKGKGNLKRWSMKRTAGGAIVIEALYQIHELGITWPAVLLCLIGITPLCLSFLEKD